MGAQPSPADLAREFGVTGMRMRGYLRERYPRDAPGKGGIWVLTQAQVDDVRRDFGGRRSPGRRGSPADASTPPEPGSYRAAWYWEGNVQAAVEVRLLADGWTIISRADTGAHQQGDDIRAIRGGTVMFVEVKGYPSRSYADSRRAGEVKPTNPTLQAHHWLAGAVLRSMRSLGAEPGVRAAIALPDFPRYRDLVVKIAVPLATLKMDVLWVSEADVRRALAATPAARGPG